MKRIGIRRETKTIWEARAPLTPEHVAELHDDHGIHVYVQPSEQRVFMGNEYTEFGADVAEDLSGCPVILGVKEIPAEFFERGKTYLFFSHTFKGQTQNLPMLARMMELGCTLIDYELITAEGGRRMVFFGRFAGLAGMIDTLWTLGRRWSAEGRDTPFADLSPAHEYESLEAVRECLAEMASRIAMDDCLTGCGPLVVGFAGYGNVSQGAQAIYDILGPTEITPSELLEGNCKDGQLYKVVFREEHLVEPTQDGAEFNLQEYYDHPERYRGVFERYLPHLAVVLNGVFWAPQYPRLVTIAALEKLYADAEPRLKVIGDISCDVGGSIECNLKATDPGNPVYVYDLDRKTAVDGVEGRGPVILAVEILPTELPRDSSQAFSEALLPLIPGLVNSNFAKRFEDWDLPAALRNAVIVHQGKLTPEYAYLQKALDAM